MRSGVVLLLLLVCINEVGTQNISTNDCTQESIDEKISCLINMVKELQIAVEPEDQPPIEEWPGNSICVECNFVAGIAIGMVEVGLLYFLFDAISEIYPTKLKFHSKADSPSPSRLTGARCILGWIGVALSALGWAYYGTIVFTYWNFVSYLMLSGLVLISPGLFGTIRASKYAKVRKDPTVQRRVKLAGWFLGTITLALFANVSLIPSQIQRHLKPTDTIITPRHNSVLSFRAEFFSEISPEKFYVLPFEDQMNVVDDFIYRKISWIEDYSNWKMVGLLLTPDEVIGMGQGDCQGQAAVTTSLLISLGFQAWMVETPFHWWTHAVDNITGRVHNLNVHGHGGNQGNVLPQPIDMVMTQPPLACENCTYINSHNIDPGYYVAPPHRAIQIALTGAHIFVRSGLTLADVSLFQLVAMGFGLGLIIALYASYYQDDFNCAAFSRRCCFGCLGGAIILVGMSFWATVLYPVTILHLLCTITFLLNYVASDVFNATQKLLLI